MMMMMIRMKKTNGDDDDKDDDEDTEADEDLSAERIPRSNPAPERRTQLHLRRYNQENDNLAFDDHHNQNYDHQKGEPSFT